MTPSFTVSGTPSNTASATASTGTNPHAYTVTSLPNNGRMITWPALDTGEYGEWAEFPAWENKCVHVSGGAVTSFVLQGSNEEDGANPQTLKDVDGSTSINAAGIFTIKDNVRMFRPNVTTGNKVVVTVICFGKIFGST